MSDDDLDLDLGEEPVKRARPPRAARPAPAPAAQLPADSKAATKAVGAKQPNLVARGLAYIKHPLWNARTFLTLLIVLVAAVLFVQNINPVRFYFMGLALELPKSIAFLLDVALGALLMWLWQRRPVRTVESGK